MSSTIAPLLPGIQWTNPDGTLTQDAADFINFVLIARLQAAPVAEETSVVSSTPQNASIGVTAIATVAAGRYRVTWYVRVSTVGTVTSSIQLTITSVDGGITCAQSSTAYTGNVTNAPQSGVFEVVADGSTPISFSFTYASNAAGTMFYTYAIVLEALP